MKRQLLVGTVWFVLALALLVPLTAPSPAQAQATTKKAWEYKLLSSYHRLANNGGTLSWTPWVISEDGDEVTGRFADNSARLGKQGWELVSVTPLLPSGERGTFEITIEYYFKRSK